MARYSTVPDVDMRVLMDCIPPVMNIGRKRIKFADDAAAKGPVAYLVSLSYPSYHVRHSLKSNLTQTRDRLLRALGAGTTLARVSPPSSP
jgi:hypothetical protein